MVPLADLYYNYITKEKLDPANFLVTNPVSMNKVIPKDNERKQRHNSVVSKTLSLCSSFSRITIDKTVYADIIHNRKKHNIFLDLDEEDVNEKKWHYMDGNDNIFGPYSTS